MLLFSDSVVLITVEGLEDFIDRFTEDALRSIIHPLRAIGEANHPSCAFVAFAGENPQAMLRRIDNHGICIIKITEIMEIQHSELQRPVSQFDTGRVKKMHDVIGTIHVLKTLLEEREGLRINRSAPGLAVADKAFHHSVKR